MIPCAELRGRLGGTGRRGGTALFENQKSDGAPKDRSSP